MVVVLLATKDKNTNHIMWPANTYFVIVAVYMIIPVYWIILSKEIRLEYIYIMQIIFQRTFTIFVVIRGKLRRSVSVRIPKRKNAKVSPK